MKEGTVLIVGRPNVGKSTFLNNLLGQKVAITSPKPQTTRLPLHVVYREKRGVITFIDTAGIFGKAKDQLAKRINQQTLSSIGGKIDVALYMVDHTRRRDFEEAKVLGIARKIKKPTLLIINKIDIEKPTYLAQYVFMKDEFEQAFEISGLHQTHVKPLLDAIFAHLPTTDRTQEDEPEPVYPLINMGSYGFIAELIREKIFLYTRSEVPYSVTVVVDEIEERKNGVMYIRARILTTEDRYKKMLIGHKGAKIKELGSLARKEIELGINKKAYLDLTVETDPHWPETYYS